MSSYRVAPMFVIRAPGLPFDHLDKLSTCRTAVGARTLLAKRREFKSARDAVEIILRTGSHGLSEELFRAWRKAIRSGVMPPATDQAASAFAICWECARDQAIAESVLNDVMQEELERARSSLLKASRALLPAYLLFGAGEFSDRLADLERGSTGAGVVPPRNSRMRERERHLLLYLQRICAKNDTFSEFGPSAWGRVDPNVRGLKIGADSGVSKREAFLERWTAHATAAAVNRDPETRPELAPRLHPNGRLEENAFFFAETNERILLEPENVRLLRRCDGKTPAHSLGVPLEGLEGLARQKIIHWEIEVPALEPHAFASLLAEIRQWRDSPVRARWLNLLDPIAALADRFAQTANTTQRREMMAEARQRLADLGGEQKTAPRHLYAASNPIAEECFRDCEFLISEKMTVQFVRDAEPWIDLWRDTYAFVASRVAAGLRRLFESTPRQDGLVLLPAFLRHCTINQMPLTGHGTVVLAHAAFQELKDALRKKLSDRTEMAEVELTLDDCHFVRNNFEYPKFDEYTYPSADLQISAQSSDAIAAGDYRWILSELHPPFALVHHCFYWSCPDPAALSDALISTVGGRPNFHFGFTAADFTSHTSIRIFEALPELTYFLSPQRGQSSFRTVAPGDAEVYLDDLSGDVCVRRRGSHQHLGSFARAWLIPLGFHPFLFGRAPHMPRLRCGNVIVQRRSWTVRLGEIAPGNYSGVSRDLVLAIEQLRSEKGWPRYIYIRPTEQALRRSGGERDKDTKPVFIDLESYLALEIFHRWLTKSGELEITEMLPDPEHLCWQEADGRRTFELRTMIVPR